MEWPAVVCAGKICERISTEERKVVVFLQFIPQALKLNCRSAISALPEECDHLAEDRGAGPRGARGGVRLIDYLLKRGKTAFAIGVAIDHEFSQDLAGIEREVEPAVLACGDVDAAVQKGARKAAPMSFGRNYYGCLARFDGRSNELRHPINEESVVFVELDGVGVAAGRHEVGRGDIDAVLAGELQEHLLPFCRYLAG
jgi:hypothetical protein